MSGLVFTWRGKPIETLDDNELRQALNSAVERVRNLELSIRDFIRLADAHPFTGIKDLESYETTTVRSLREGAQFSDKWKGDR